MLDAKVSLSQFDRTTEQLNALVQELLDKLSTSVRHTPKLAQLVLPVLVAPRHCGTRVHAFCRRATSATCSTSTRATWRESSSAASSTRCAAGSRRSSSSCRSSPPPDVPRSPTSPTRPPASASASALSLSLIRTHIYMLCTYVMYMRYLSLQTTHPALPLHLVRPAHRSGPLHCVCRTAHNGSLISVVARL